MHHGCTGPGNEEGRGCGASGALAGRRPGGAAPGRGQPPIDVGGPRPVSGAGVVAGPGAPGRRGSPSRARQGEVVLHDEEEGHGHGEGHEHLDVVLHHTPVWAAPGTPGGRAGRVDHPRAPGTPRRGVEGFTGSPRFTTRAPPRAIRHGSRAVESDPGAGSRRDPHRRISRHAWSASGRRLATSGSCGAFRGRRAGRRPGPHVAKASR